MARLIPAFLSCLVLGAHFLRWGRLSAVFVVVFLPFLALILQKRWALRALQVVLVLGVGVWLVTAARFGRERLAEGRPWVRMSVILSGVAAFTGASAWLLSRPVLLKRFPD